MITSNGSSEKTKLGARGRRLYCSTICPTASPYMEKSGPTALNGPGGQLESKGKSMEKPLLESAKARRT